ncbi:hypothetical protein [Idiomarina aquatica]|uniref:Uncharacterized protein n=1 Tax=Idiomarina aquatica TaxID=1327752 RepID=A0AA94EFT2_9GAMM|nr:hypothetical protein [Idiomarina aquatica]RUO45051.1 hypothetical protein CWE23_03245 [Idiomarina aquatica]
MLNEDSFTLVLYEPKKNALIVKTYEQCDTEQVWRLSLNIHEWVEPLFVNDEYDVIRVLENKGEVTGFSFIADLPDVK